METEEKRVGRVQITQGHKKKAEKRKWRDLEFTSFVGVCSALKILSLKTDGFGEDKSAVISTRCLSYAVKYFFLPPLQCSGPGACGELVSAVQR